VLLFGRFLSGLGGETVIIATWTWVVLWFKDRHLTLNLGLYQIFSRSGLFLNAFITPAFSSKYSLELNFYLGSLISIVSILFCGLAYYISSQCLVVEDYDEKKYESPLTLLKKSPSFPSVILLLQIMKLWTVFNAVFYSTFFTYNMYAS